MMKDKLTKSNKTKFDRLCNRLRYFGLFLIAGSIASFIPVNHILQADKEVMVAEMQTNDEEKIIDVVLQKKIINFRNHRIFKR